MHRILARARAAAAALLLTLAGAALASAQEPAPREQGFTPEIGLPGKDVIWMPTVDTLLTAMLDAAQVKPGDLVIDLGSGDGRIPIAAAHAYGARARGIEYNPDLVKLSIENAKKAGVADKVEFIEGDIFKIDWSMADVLTLYLLPELNLQIREDILKMRPGTRVVSNSFTMGDWKPDRVLTVERRNAYFWIVPADITGRWKLKPQKARPYRVHVVQKYQVIEAIEARRGWRRLEVRDAHLAGPEATFTLVDGEERSKVRVRIDGDRMSGGLTLTNGTELPLQGKRTSRE